MSDLYTSRSGYASPKFSSASLMPPKEFLERALKAVKKRKGLLHGKMIDKNHRVCALGAVAQAYGDFDVSLELAEGLQRVNDSVPKARPATRRAKVIAWLERKLMELK